MKLNGIVNITQKTDHIGRSIISVTVRDVNSRLRAANISIPIETFAKALTGAEQLCTFEPYDNVSNLGRIKETKELLIPISSGISMPPKEQALERSASYADPGWVASSYFGSKDSFYIEHGGFHDSNADRQWARTTQCRYVDPPEVDPEEEARSDDLWELKQTLAECSDMSELMELVEQLARGTYE